MINRTFAAALSLCLLTASYANAGGRGHNTRHHDNRDFRNAGSTFASDRLFKGIGKDERNDLFNDNNNLGAEKQIGGGKGSNKVIWASSGPDCLVAPVQTSSSTDAGKAHRADHAKR